MIDKKTYKNLNIFQIFICLFISLSYFFKCFFTSVNIAFLASSNFISIVQPAAFMCPPPPNIIHTSATST